MPNTVSAEVVKITPKMAREILEANHVNRRIRDRLVRSFRDDMENGRWVMTGEAVKISRTGALLDGQHRLAALAEAKVRSVEFLVVRGLLDESQALMDSGAPRSIADAIEFTYGPHVPNLAIRSALSRWLAVAPEPVPDMHQKMKYKVSTALAVETYAAHPDLGRAAEVGMRIRGTARLLVSPSALGYSWMHLHRTDDEACERYFWAMEHMQFNEGVHDPRLAAYRRLQVLSEESVQGANSRIAVAVVSVITRSWNTWRKGEELQSITYKGPRGLIGPVRPV